jgi:DNA-binding response OmpR family regulator
MELRARIGAHLRREKREHVARLSLGRICFMLESRKMMIDDKEVNLTKAEYDICEFLAKNRGQIFSKEQILEKVLGYDSESSDSTIITHIKNIRTKLSCYEYMPIKTVWGIGYKWEE